MAPSLPIVNDLTIKYEGPWAIVLPWNYSRRRETKDTSHFVTALNRVFNIICTWYSSICGSYRRHALFGTERDIAV